MTAENMKCDVRKYTSLNGTIYDAVQRDIILFDCFEQRFEDDPTLDDLIGVIVTKIMIHAPCAKEQVFLLINLGSIFRKKDALEATSDRKSNVNNVCATQCYIQARKIVECVAEYRNMLCATIHESLAKCYGDMDRPVESIRELYLSAELWKTLCDFDRASQDYFFISRLYRLNQKTLHLGRGIVTCRDSIMYLLYTHNLANKDYLCELAKRLRILAQVLVYVDGGLSLASVASDYCMCVYRVLNDATPDRAMQQAEAFRTRAIIRACCGNTAYALEDLRTAIDMARTCQDKSAQFVSKILVMEQQLREDNKQIVADNMARVKVDISVLQTALDFKEMNHILQWFKSQSLKI